MNKIDNIGIGVHKKSQHDGSAAGKEDESAGCDHSGIAAIQLGETAKKDDEQNDSYDDALDHLRCAYPYQTLDEEERAKNCEQAEELALTDIAKDAGLRFARKEENDC